MDITLFLYPSLSIWAVPEPEDAFPFRAYFLQQFCTDVSPAVCEIVNARLFTSILFTGYQEYPSQKRLWNRKAGEERTYNRNTALTTSRIKCGKRAQNFVKMFLKRNERENEMDTLRVDFPEPACFVRLILAPKESSEAQGLSDAIDRHTRQRFFRPNRSQRAYMLGNCRIDMSDITLCLLARTLNERSEKHCATLISDRIMPHS